MTMHCCATAARSCCPSSVSRVSSACSRHASLIIGLGGLGSPAAMYLAAAGIGTLELADDDQVDLSNLQRQILHTTRSHRQRKDRLGAGPA